MKEILLLGGVALVIYLATRKEEEEPEPPIPPPTPPEVEGQVRNLQVKW